MEGTAVTAQEAQVSEAEKLRRADIDKYIAELYFALKGALPPGAAQGILNATVDNFRMRHKLVPTR